MKKTPFLWSLLVICILSMVIHIQDKELRYLKLINKEVLADMEHYNVPWVEMTLSLADIENWKSDTDAPDGAVITPRN